MVFISNYSYAADSIIANRNKALVNESMKLGKQVVTFVSHINKNKAESIPVLLYHHILPQKDMDAHNWNNNGSVISLENFKKQMDHLRDNGYYTATMQELELYIEGRLNLPKKTVVITFDDGYLSNVIYAYPIMKEYGFKGSIFLVGSSSLVDAEEFNPKELQHIPINELEKYEDVFEFTCHTFNMHVKEGKVTMLENSSREEIENDLSRNLGLLGTKYIAYPFGGYNTKTIEYVKGLGYTLGFTVQHGYVTKGHSKYELPRVIITPSINMEKFIELINPM